MPPQRHEARVHLGGNRAGVRARRPLGGPEAGWREGLGEIVEDRKRLPDADVAVNQHRHLAAAGQLADARLEVLGIERDHLLRKGDAGDLHREPRTERP